MAEAVGSGGAPVGLVAEAVGSGCAPVGLAVGHPPVGGVHPAAAAAAGLAELPENGWEGRSCLCIHSHALRDLSNQSLRKQYYWFHALYF